MARDQQDVRLLEALTSSLQNVQGLEVGPDTRAWRDNALALLETASAEFERLVFEEDTEEFEAFDALGQLRALRKASEDVFEDVHAALEIVWSQLRLSHKAPGEAEIELEHFVQHFHAGEFSSLRDGAAMRVLGHGATLLSGWDDERAAGLRSRAAGLLERYAELREQAAGEGAEAVEAYASLVEGRAIARICYLTARDLLSATLRFENRHDTLDDIIAPISDLRVYSVG